MSGEKGYSKTNVQDVYTTFRLGYKLDNITRTYSNIQQCHRAILNLPLLGSFVPSTLDLSLRGNHKMYLSPDIKKIKGGAGRGGMLPPLPQVYTRYCARGVFLNNLWVSRRNWDRVKENRRHGE